MRIFPTTFPSGPLGLGLLLLRVVVAARFAIEGAARLAAVVRPGAGLDGGAAAAALLLTACAVLMALGLMTPLVALIIAIFEVAVAGGHLHAFAVAAWREGALIGRLFDAAILVCLALTGPGVYSVDAHLFGREEIIIPRRTDLHNG